MTSKEGKYLTQLGKKIKALRQQKNIAQSELADSCKFQKASMSRIETGKTNITVTTLCKIAVGLEVELKDLF